MVRRLVLRTKGRGARAAAHQKDACDPKGRFVRAEACNARVASGPPVAAPHTPARESAVS